MIKRKFDYGNERIDVPLIAVVGASNELPDSEELEVLRCFLTFMLKFLLPAIRLIG